MFPNELFEQRRELCSAISTLPPDYLRDNAAALLAITSEFQRSLALELQIIQQVKRLDPKDRVRVSEFANQFSNYIEQRDFNLERTRCSQIRRIYDQQITSLKEGSPSDKKRVEELDNFLKRFKNADVHFTEQIEPVMDRALTAVQKFNYYVQADQTTEARQCQTDFVSEYGAELKQLKDMIKEMNLLGNSLIDKL